jgi:hypothetical protein
MILRKSHTAAVAVALTVALTGFGVAGCSSKTASCSDFSGKLDKSVSDMNANVNNPDALVKNMQDVSKQVHDKANSASDAKVKAALTSFATDWDAFIAKFQAVKGGDTSAASDIATLATKIQADGTAVQTACK